MLRDQPSRLRKIVIGLGIVETAVLLAVVAIVSVSIVQSHSVPPETASSATPVLPRACLCTGLLGLDSRAD